MKTTEAARIGGRGLLLTFFLAQLAHPKSLTAQIIDPTLGPVIRIVSPANHAVFYTPVDIPIFAYVRPEPNVTFTNVEFYAGSVDLGKGLKLGSTNSLKPIYGGLQFNSLPRRLGSLYCFVWTNAPLGSNTLTAVASGFAFLSSVSRTSPPVNITILPGPAVSNSTDVVSIVATDPIAIAGTNSSWTWKGSSNATADWGSWPPPRWQIYTNWGPKAALFIVRRFGDATDALTVNYSIGGTASNGVDYAMLPGFVDIPAGGAFGLIPIVPIDNGTSSVPKTVVLTLTPSTNVPPDYAIGFPSRAAVIIFYNWLRLPPRVLADGSFAVSAAGPDGAWFSLQGSPDLLSWTELCTGQAFQGSIDFVDPDAPAKPIQFYRPVPLNAAPAP
jgi:hypothetical protein